MALTKQAKINRYDQKISEFAGKIMFFQPNQESNINN